MLAVEVRAHPAGDGMVLDDAGRTGGGGRAVVVVDGSLAHAAGAAADGPDRACSPEELRKLVPSGAMR